MSKKPLALIIMDGFGINPDSFGNAIMAATTPNLCNYWNNNPHTQLGASGMDVGLPDGQMGNSEVGHTNMGAGRIVYQELTRITKSIRDGDFFTNPVINEAMDAAKAAGKRLHLYGLLSDGGVHSHNTHLYALLELAKKKGFAPDDVFVHCFMDGRDVPPESGKEFVAELTDKLRDIGVGKIGVISGRYYAMDRDTNWDRVKKAYDALTQGVGNHAPDGVTAMAESYQNGKTDEFVVPVVIDGAKPIESGDSIIFYNFRPDRAREITRVFVDPDFKGFERKLLKVNYVCMTQYDASMPNVEVAFKPEALTNTFGEYISEKGLTQLRIAETEKYAHVTFFFNGGVEKQYPGEERILVNSPKVATYDLKPEMSAFDVTDRCTAAIDEDNLDVIILNFANCDMVGHTGVFDAAKAAVEAVDKCVGRVAEKVLSKGGSVLITADHGNADKMYEPDGSPFTAHTTNPVPFIVLGQGSVKLRDGGVLADIAPTMLKILGLPQPTEMTGKSIIE
ncbi:MAG: 2,3-bisphosphoglycerate-independent phosphoglycerate mutase [Ruminococcus sp.]|jgi:2,3-bisphosphoglycerate-independent phosphoglycerate mutase|nr:2,3-bisphosphoglycerate-independent phosphoglycerate mutase [Ruminococcus sp.]